MRCVSVLGWVDVGIDPYGVESQLYESVQHLRNRTISRAGKIASRPIFDVRNSMIQPVYRIPFVGADDPVRPLKSCNSVRSVVGADAHIGPLKCCDFALNFRKNGNFPRADRVVRPYGVKNETLYNNARPPSKSCDFPRTNRPRGKIQDRGPRPPSWSF